MIKNNQQYLLAKRKLERLDRIRLHILQRPIDALVLRNRNEDLARVEELAGLLQSEISEYETTTRTTTVIPELDCVGELPSHILRARRVLDWSQETLAEKSGTCRKQIYRYEGNNYSSASFETVVNVSKALASGLQERRDNLCKLRDWLASRRAEQQSNVNSDTMSTHESGIADDSDAASSVQADITAGSDAAISNQAEITADSTAETKSATQLALADFDFSQ